MIRSLAISLCFAATAARAESSQSLNAFGLALQRECALAEPTRNIMTSPVALFQALGMAANGAAGATRLELLRRMAGEAGSIEALNSVNQECQTALSSAGVPGKRLPRVRIANAAWDSAGFGVDGGLTFADDYASALRTSYRADVGSLDFSKPGAAKVINAWAKERTFGLIPAVVSAREIKDLIFLLLNTTYFEGSWAKPFDLIRPGAHSAEFTKFASAPGREKHVAVIQKTANFGYKRTVNEEIVEIPFVSPEGRRFVFYAVLPARGLTDLAGYWSSAFWTKLLADMRKVAPEEGRVTMPKFAFEFDLKMTERSTLAKALGLDFLFAESANFGAIKAPHSVPAKVGLIKEITRIELDENGVKAAAAVAVGGLRVLGGRLSVPKFDVRFDRPFVFAIAEKLSGTLLFTGALHDPGS